MAKLTLDLHDIFNKHHKIEQSLEDVVKEALETKVKTVEIIPGKGSGQLKKRVIRFFQQKAIKSKYHRLEKDSNNFGRIFIHFKH
ncbi:MAG: Smr/MutS family protein [Vicingaceae bacterium]